MYNMRAGRVISYVSKDGLTVKNVTLPDHVLYDGQITRRAFQVENGAWFVETRGIGNNVRPGMDYANQWHGPEVFNELDRRMKENIGLHHGLMY